MIKHVPIFNVHIISIEAAFKQKKNQQQQQQQYTKKWSLLRRFEQLRICGSFS